MSAPYQLQLGALGASAAPPSWAPEKAAAAPAKLSFELDNSAPDAVQIIARLQQFGDSYGKTGFVIDFARSLVADITTNNDRAAHFWRVGQFLLDHVTYLSDPVGVEYVRSPLRMLSEYGQTGQTQGDCDDMVVLGNSLFNALGFRTRVAAVALPGSSYPNHVLSQVLFNGQWVFFDACNPQNPTRGWSSALFSTS